MLSVNSCFSLIDVHFTVVERILCYLKKDLGRGFLYTKGKKLSVEAYADADWAGSVDDSRSTLGYCIYLEENLVIWGNKRQIMCVSCISEAEYMAIVIGVTELLWIKFYQKT